MAQPFTVTARVADATEWSDAGDYFVPGRFSATIHPLRGDGREDFDAPLVELDVSVIDGSPRCDEIRIRRRGKGAGLSSDEQRFPLATYLRAALQLHSIRLDAAGKRRLRRREPKLYAELQKLPRRPRPRVGRANRVDDTKLRRVAETYRRAVHEERPPKIAVANTEHVAESTAGRYIVLARKRGFLRPTRGGARGEAATATSRAS